MSIIVVKTCINNRILNLRYLKLWGESLQIKSLDISGVCRIIHKTIAVNKAILLKKTRIFNQHLNIKGTTYI